jgi:hypothetical protein
MKRFPRHPFRKKESARRIYLLPNLFTTGNILCGVMSVMYTLEGRFTAAAYMIILGFNFDILDGRIARLTNTGSVFGINYDSLSDLMTFRSGARGAGLRLFSSLQGQIPPPGGFGLCGLYRAAAGPLQRPGFHHRKEGV